MKHLITITFLLFFGWTLGFSQAYAPFPTDSTVWREAWVTGDSGYTSGSGISLYSLFGDTIIDGKIYTKLYRGNMPFSQIESLMPSQLPSNGFIREEQKIIYYYPATELFGFQGETILYNFNLEVGDTMYWNTDVFWNGGESAIVSGIDSVQIETGEYRKQYFYNGTWSGQGANAIEGIGSTYGLLLPNYGGTTLDFGNVLMCVATPQNLTYTTDSPWGWPIDSLEQCLEVPTSTEQVPQNSLKIFPNPTTGIIHLSETIYQVQVEVFSATGQKVLSLNDFTGSTIDLKDYPPGLYLLVISGDEEYVGKIIKNR